MSVENYKIRNMCEDVCSGNYFTTPLDVTLYLLYFVYVAGVTGVTGMLTCPKTDHLVNYS